MNRQDAILIVGGAGYIGSHVNKLLSSLGYKTIVFDNLSCGYKDFVKWGEFILGDLSDKEQLKLCFRKYSILATMHFSASAYVEESVRNPAKYYINNVSNTLNLLETMREFGVKYFIFSSTCATYGIPLEIPITEEHPQNPINPYGRSKLMIEQILKDYEHAYGIKHINLRYFNAAGADPDLEIGEWHEPETHLIPIVLEVAFGKREYVSIYGTDYDTPDGTCIRDYVHVCDLASAHILALEFLMKENKSESFNLGTGSGFSVREVIEVARRVTKREIKVVEVNRRPGDPPVLIASSQKAIDILKWKPKFSELEFIIETAWKWYLKRLIPQGKK